MTVEREVKIQVAPDLVLPPLDDVRPGISGSKTAQVRTTTIYVDTDDLRLARWGWSLRHRDDEGWTVKLPRSTDGPLVVRSEYRFDGTPDELPPDGLDLVTAAVRGAPVGPVAELATTRRTTRLAADASIVAEVMDDRVRIARSPVPASPFREIEIEMLEERPDVLDAVLARLASAGMHWTVPALTKYERAIGGRPDPELPLDGALEGDKVYDVVRAAIAASTRRLIVHDPGVRVGEDPEAVHQARVAVRRLRSDLRTFGAWLDQTWSDGLRAELRWIADRLGAVRDADVLLDRFGRRVDGLDDVDRRRADRLIAKLRDERDARRTELLSAMREDRYVHLLDRLVDAARDPGATADARETPGSDAAGAVERAWRRLDRSVDGLGAQPTDADLHTVRIRSKRLRYAAEALIPVFGKPARRFAARAAKLQDILGEHQDAVVAEAWLRNATRGARSRAAFVAGELTAAERRSAERAAASWPAAWDRLRRKRLRFWA